MDVNPQQAMSEINSSFNISNTFLTPSCPPQANPYKIGRPIKTPRAPNANAFNMSVPVRIPVSTNTRIK